MVREGDTPVTEQPPVAGPAEAKAVALAMLENEVQEVMLAILLDTKHRVIATHEIARGDLNALGIQPREAFRAAIMLPAASLILAHNHPSGCNKPSAEDIVFTRRMEKAGKLLGIKVVDHIIVGAGTAYSMADDINAGVIT